MRPFLRPFRYVTAATLLAIATLGAFAVTGSLPSATGRSSANGAVSPSVTSPSSTSTTTTKATVATPATTAAPAVAHAPARVVASGNAQLDALLRTLPAVLFEAGATVHFGYNPVDCCHAGGYNPKPNEVWVSVKAFSSAGRLTYVAVHELAHSVHLKTARGAALTAAVAGAPSVRAGEWDVSEKVADCVAWALYPSETAASGITYWSCPDPWRSQVRAALAG